MQDETGALLFLGGFIGFCIGMLAGVIGMASRLHGC